MSTFLAVYKQVEEGCKYTIGCGIRVVKIDADTMEDAFQQAMVEMGWDDLGGSDMLVDIASVTLYEVVDEDSDKFEDFRAEAESATMDAETRRAETRRDEEEFARLANKLGKTV